MAHRAAWWTLAIGIFGATSGCGTSHIPNPGDGGVGDAGMLVLDACACADAGPPRLASCSGMDARAAVCPELTCDGPSLFYWDGNRCFPIGCGECEGSDCARGVSELALCEAAHESCEAALCRDTGGDWLEAYLYCGHHECGAPGASICDEPTQACNCGPSSSFVRGVGCAPDPTCAAPDPGIDPEALCAATHGTWADTCCPSTCGVPCAAECLAPACSCGPLQVWDPITGCTDASRCMERQAGEICTLGTRCADGLICCQHCGGDGCAPDSTCEAPVCDADPTIDLCGNDLIAP